MAKLPPPFPPIGFAPKEYLFYDDFSDTRAAGAVNGTLATHPGSVHINGTPAQNTRAAVDANSKLTIAGGEIAIATGGAGVGNPGYWLGVITRTAGRRLIGTVTPTTARVYFGFDVGQTGRPDDSNALLFRAATSVLNVYDNNNEIGVASIASGTAYTVAVVLRSTGAFYFLKVGNNWVLLYPSEVNNTATLYPMFGAGDTTTVAKAKLFYSGYPLWLPVPLVSDSFNRSNGVLGSTDGAGHTEANGGGGLAWSAVGTWAIATNKANCSALSGSVGIATVTTPSADVVASIAVTRAAGAAGLVLRYVDSDNYLYAYHDGTNAALISRALGVESNVVAPTAATYAAGGKLWVVVDGTTARLFYNGALVGTGTVPASTATKHGLWTNDTNPTLDNFQCWARGNEGQYNSLGGDSRPGDPLAGGPWVYLDEGFANLAAWSTESGSASVAGGIASLADAGAGATEIRTLPADVALPTNRAYVLDVNLGVPAGQTCAVYLRNATTEIAKAIINGNGNNTVTLSSEDVAAANVTPTNWDGTAKFKLVIFVDPVAKLVLFYLYWKDTSTLQDRMELIGDDTAWTFTNAPTMAGFATGDVPNGTVTIQDVKIARPWGVFIGDSIATGHIQGDPIISFYTPNDPTSSIGFTIEQAALRRVHILNQGRGGDSTSDVLARYADMVVSLAPKYAFILIGSNDAYNAYDMATSKTRLGTIVDALNAAGIKAVLFEIPPRDNFDAAGNAWKVAWNAWLPGFCASKSALFVPIHDALALSGDGTKLGYTIDNVHPSAAGYHVAGNIAWSYLCN